ncbi:MAG: Stp1/IreP family PP2C-type Ser/Thr phosphatase [Clostridiales bacterium]|jgi:protein phosphatase|nr:Stp1/IreP family PP2C-type Ser/Thr phosphatase [Clostridiales bacterium]
MKLIAKTDKGLVRSTNQDAYITGELSDGVAVAVVCDGMGGAKGGNIASSLAVKLIYEQLSEQFRVDMQSNSIKNMLQSVLNAANIGIYNISRSNSELEGMGTTVVTAIIKNDTAYIAHAGDSRAYLINKDGLMRLTHDHSIVQQLVDSGTITQAAAQNHPRSNIITRALGVDEYINVDFTEHPFSQGDCLLICTDGLTGSLSDEKIAKVAEETEYHILAEKLVQLAKQNGGKDNITVVTIA